MNKRIQFPEQTRTVLPGLLVLTMFLAGCKASAVEPDILPANTSVPTWTPTVALPTATVTPTPTRTPAPTQTPVCSLDETLLALRQLVPYEEYSLLQTRIQNSASLAIWFVDPALDEVPLPEELESGLDRARMDAAELTDLLRNASPCIDQLFDMMNPIVVDSSYTGWLSAEIPVREVPSREEMSEGRYEYIVDHFQEGYLIDAPPYSYTPGSCNWPEAHSRLWNHFSRDRQNVAFYFVVDRNGPNVWAQWDGPTDPVLMALSLGNILLALDCFTPEANLIFTVVDQDGNAGLIGYVPRMNVDDLQILYAG